MSDPKEKKPGSGSEKRSAGQSAGKRVAGKPGPRAPKRSTGGPKSSGTRKAEPPRTTQQKILRGLYIALTVVSAIIVLGYIGVNLFAAPPDVGPSGPDGPDRTPRPRVTTTVDESGNVIEVEIPGLPADRKKEFYTFLVVGQSQDSGGKLSDTMMLVAYDVPNQKLSVMNLPRDTYVRYQGVRMLNAVYNRAGGDKDGKGIQGLKNAVEDLTGIYPDFHVIIQWEALGELVDAIGGVYFDVPFDMYYNDLSQHFKIDVKKGYQLLDGEGAMGVVRWRQNSIGNTGMKDPHYGYADGDLGRIKTQQAFMKAVIAKCIQPDVLLGNLSEYINIFQRNVITDLSVANMAYFGKAAIGGLDMENVTFVTLPNNYAGDGHLVPVGSQIVKAVNESFNPYEDDIRLSELTLATMDDVPRRSAAPAETEDPDVTNDPGAPEDPDSSQDPQPTQSGDVILPPGSFSRPSASPRPTESGSPEGSPRPSESGDPGPTASPRPSGVPGGIVIPSGTPVERETPVAPPDTEPTPPPTDTPAPLPADTPSPAEEEPLLPPM